MKQIVKKIDFLKVAEVILAVSLVTAPVLAAAQLNPNAVPCTGTGLNCTAGAQGVNGLIGQVIKWVLSIAFAIAVLFLIIGGFWYVTSAGNEETAEKGKATVLNAVIGMVIIILSYVIINVVSSLVSGSGSSSGGGVTAP